MNRSKIVAKILQNPRGTWIDAVAIMRGHALKLLWRFTKPKVHIGKGFRAYVYPVFEGPGHITLGDRVSFVRNYGKCPYFVTHTPEARIVIGSDGVMSGLRISCTQSVEIGTNSVLANSIIADSEKLPAATDQSATVAALCGTKPVLIGSHVWIAMNSYIMSGTVLGDECVVASGAVVFGATMEPRSLVGGNPGRKLAETRAP